MSRPHVSPFTLVRPRWRAGARRSIAPIAALACTHICLAQSLMEPEAPVATPVFRLSAPANAASPGGNATQKPAASTPSDGRQEVSAGAKVEPSGQAPNASRGQSNYSLFAVVPPVPKTWAKHDLVEIIINESSVQSLQHTQDLQKTYDAKAQLDKFPSLSDLFTQLTLREGIGTIKPGLGVTSDNNFKGDAKLNRKDQITAKITATVIDVKPNGTLVLEAKESITTDREISTMVLSGVCRSDDITKSNTLQSSQLANLTIRIEHEGDVKDASEKGLIPRIIDEIFNF